MIISDKYRFVFIHNPKCGGTSVRKALQDYDTRNNHFWMFAEVYGVKVDKAHMPLYLLRVYSPRDYDILKTYFTFMFVRHPIERCISGFNETHKGLVRDLVSKKVTYDEYCATLNSFVQGLTEKKINGYNVGYRHFVRQSDFCYLEGKRLIDVVLRIEEYPSNLETVAVHHAVLASKLKSGMSVKNASPTQVKSYKDVLNEKSISILYDVYREDFINFSYS